MELILITFLVVWIIDLSGIIDSIENGLGKWLKCKVNIPKPFSCSLCSTWWVGLIYLLIVGKFNLYMIAYVGLLAFLTPFFYNLLILIRDLLNKLIDLVYSTLKLE
jgi:hypothetical protein